MAGLAVRLGVLIVVAVVGGFSAGCTHTRVLQVHDADAVERVNRQLEHRTVTVVFLDGVQIHAEEARVTPEALSWRPRDAQQARTSTLETVRDLSVRSRGRGALEGAAIGFLIFAPAGALFSDGDSRVVAALATGAGGAIWSAAIGAIRASRTLWVNVASP